MPMKAVTIRLGEGGVEPLLKRVRVGQELGFDSFDLTIESPQIPLERLVPAFKQHHVKLCALRLSEPKARATVFRRPGYSKLGARDPQIAQASAQMVLETALALAPLQPEFIVLDGGFLDLPGLAEKQMQLDEALDCGEGKKLSVTPELLSTVGAHHEQQTEALCRGLHRVARGVNGPTLCLLPTQSPFGLLMPRVLEHVFEDLSKERVGYWHSTANAGILAKLGLVKHEDWIARFGTRLKGVYLGDTMGCQGDQTPGLGEIDFKKIAPELAQATVRVLVVDDASATKLRFGSDYLSKVGIF